LLDGAALAGGPDVGWTRETAMRRDFDLTRALLLDVEGETDIDLSTYSDEQVRYHKALLIDAGLAEGNVHYSSREFTEVPDRVLIRKLTWNGHEFLDQAKPPATWQRAKEYVANKGLELTFDTAKAALTTVVKQALS
jgi:hypothetical protein